MRKLHEDQTHIWKQEAKKTIAIMVTALEEQIESLKYQLNENQQETQSLKVFKDQALQFCLIIRKNQSKFYKKMRKVSRFYQEITNLNEIIYSLVEEDKSIKKNVVYS